MPCAHHRRRRRVRRALRPRRRFAIPTSATRPTSSWCATPGRTSTPRSSAPGCARPRPSWPDADHRRLGRRPRAVIGGFLMAGGALSVLVQPSEFVVIGGAAVGSLLISTPTEDRQDARSGRSPARSDPARRRSDYVDLLAMQYQIFKLIQQSGVMALEAHFEDPAKSPILGTYPKFLAPSRGGGLPGRLGQGDHRRRHRRPRPRGADGRGPRACTTRTRSSRRPRSARSATRCPGLGIVAAVLGVVITMGHIDAPPAEIGHHVGAALVGTFLGILAVVRLRGAARRQPGAARERGAVLLLSASRPACSPSTRATRRRSPIEFARRALPHDVRPTFNETEQFCRAAASGKAEEAAAA